MAQDKKLSAGQSDDMAVQLERELVEILQIDAGMHEREAAYNATVLVQGLRKRFGGWRLGVRGLYIPAPDKAERDQAIRRDFNGNNSQQLSRKYGVSRARIYQIISAGFKRNAQHTGPDKKSMDKGEESSVSSHEI
jgi:Mor family transcriptional regulator